MQSHTESGELKSDSVGTSQVADGTITEDKLEPSAQAKLNAAGSGNVADDSITTAQLQDGSVTNSKLAADAVTNAKVAAGAAISQSKIANLTSDLAGKAPAVHTHTKADVSLGNVDNTSDVNKPISTATQAALDAKATMLTIGQYQVPARTSAGTGEPNGGQGYASTVTNLTLALRTSTGTLAAANGVNPTDVVNKSQLDAKLDASQKAAANGVASLNASTRVPAAQLGTGTADTTTYLRGDGAWEPISSSSHTHTSTQVTDFNSAVDSRVAAAVNSAPVIFEHGSNAAAIRPATSAAVWWVGTVSPTHWLDGDAWMDTTVSGSTPSMPADLVADFYVTDIIGADGATITTWNSRTGSQTFTASGAPVLHTTDRNLEFDGVDDYMDAPISSANPETVIMVYQLPASVASVPVLGSSTTLHTISVTSSSKLQTNAGTSLPTAANAPASSWLFSAHVFDGANSRVRVGDTDVTGNAGTNARTTARLATNTGATAFGNIKVKAVLFFNRNLTYAEVSNVKTILQTELGMTL